MMKDETRERLVFKNYRWTAPKYYDYPDGQDLAGKLSFTTKMGFFAGAYVGLIYALRSTPGPRLSAKTMVFKALTVVPGFVVAPFAFTTVTYMSTNYRKKDDQINYMLGGVAAGVTGTTLLGLQQYRVFFSLVFAILGLAKKTAEMNGTKLFPPTVKKRIPPYYDRLLDFSSVKDGEPSWTTTLPAVQK